MDKTFVNEILFDNNVLVERKTLHADYPVEEWRMSADWCDVYILPSYNTEEKARECAAIVTSLRLSGCDTFDAIEIAQKAVDYDRVFDGYVEMYDSDPS